MQLISISKLNNACSNSFQRAVIRQVKSLEQVNLSSNLYFDAQIFNKRSNFLRCYGTNRNNYYNKVPVINPSLSLFRGVPERGYGNVGNFAKLSLGNQGALKVVADKGRDSRLLVGDISLGNQGALKVVAHKGRDSRLLVGDISLGNQDALRVVAHKGSDSRLFSGQCLRHCHVSCSASNAAAASAADAPLDISVRDDQRVDSADSSACKHVGTGTLKLNSGSCYLPHPEKLKTGGEDAHFICEEKQVIGVADGVGGWAEVGIDAGFYARLLMSNSLIAIKEDSKGSVDPAKVLVKAHANTNIMGSSTACIVALTEQGINAINLGDSAFIVIRDGSTVFRSPVQQYGFNFPYQLASGSEGDSPSSGQVFTFPVAPGDVLVAGTDGLFDNMFDNEIATLVVEAMKEGVEPHITAQNIANLAQQKAQDCHRKSPFAAAAHDAGLSYIGGKLDDITVVVSYIIADN
ncbi:hypothetical protein KSS87_004686 [Heliosperma pusillum]|nr:hypothetical protein KSS87_001520 [Heliosperma pusillum]KAH9621111.1 hypothetical protein KSS87_004686 [Heliosperma pusillum]